MIFYLYIYYSYNSNVCVDALQTPHILPYQAVVFNLMARVQ